MATIIAIVITAIIASLITSFFYKKKINRLAPKWFNRWNMDVAEKVTQATLDAIYILDREHRMRDVVNYDPTEIPVEMKGLIDKLAYEYMDEENSKKIAKIIDQTFKTDETLITNYRVDVEGDSSYYYEGRFKRINSDYIICIAHDITQDYLYEQGLIENQHKLKQAQKINQLILNNASCGLVYIDADFVVQFENLHTISEEGFNMHYQKGEYCFQRVKGRNSPCDNCVAQSALLKKEIQKGELIINNNTFFEVTATPIFTPGGNQAGVVLKYDNVTIREQAAQELQRAKETAEASDKLKSQFLSNMSHEIRTPLNAIVGFSDLLITTEDKESREEYGAIIKRNNDLLLQLINDILDISRIESDQLEFVYSDVHINEMLLALQLSSNLKLANNPEVSIVFNPPATDYIIHTEANRILQVLSNFVNNAIKFTPKGKIKIGYELQEEGVRFYVSDTGIGISEEQRKEIFKRFVKLNEFAKGTGLGLSICASIIKKLKGEIGVNSKAEEGSTFWFTLPVKPTTVSTQTK